MFFGNPGRPAPTTYPFGNHPTLVNDLFSYWRFEESSGTMYDAHSYGLNLTRGGPTEGYAGVTRITGKHGYGMGITGVSAIESSYVYRTGTANFGATAYLTYAFWFKFTTDTPLSIQMFAGYGPGLSPLNYDFGIQTVSSYFGLRIFNTSGSHVYTDTYSVLPSAAVWHHYFAEIDPVAKTATLTIDNSTTGTTTVLPGTMRTSATELYLGIGAIGSPTRSFDEMGFWRRQLTTSEKAALYNNGVGLFY